MTALYLQITYKGIGVEFKDMPSTAPSYPLALCPIHPLFIIFPVTFQSFFLEFIPYSLLSFFFFFPGFYYFLESFSNFYQYQHTIQGSLICYLFFMKCSLSTNHIPVISLVYLSQLYTPYNAQSFSLQCKIPERVCCLYLVSKPSYPYIFQVPNMMFVADLPIILLFLSYGDHV